jgi:DMSO/TMAO reductase YedYZ heme-binding membrane subunit
MATAAIGSSSTAYWYLTRATGVVALVLLTFVVALGVIDVARFSSDRWPRFLTDGIHRSMSLLAVSFVAVHIVTTLLDTYAPIGLLDALIPFHSSYRPIWLGLGAAAFDLLLAVIVTSLMRARIGAGTWRSVHWLAYACWPLALIHGLGTGTDARQGWMLTITVLCVVSVLISVAVRVWATDDVTGAGRAAGIGLPLAFVLGLAIWLPGGPLAAGWAKRAGTPSTLLRHASVTTTVASSR